MNLAAIASDENTGQSLKELVPSLDEALLKLSPAAAIVLDVRFNEGGQDAVALAFANRFADQKRAAYKKQACFGDRAMKLETQYMEPQGDSYKQQPIILLTSILTESAAETFVQSMRQLPNVKIAGERTAGFFSDALTRLLPNGESFTLSNERYYTMDGVLLEGNGIVPDVEIPIQLSSVDKGIDPALEWVLQDVSKQVR
ncbi:S41 family peptidase [Paenibacillus solisilvae]|uniref:S41 family peptidase n=1 Tax=Paenibacillus solisilvae TaxID=2486751 RepID=A0ABW0VYU8_9BACL